MHKPAHVVEIFLSPGEFYIGDRDTRIRTVLGSCVSITMWHPRLLVGGMCHYMLPGRQGREPGQPDGKYADEAFALMVEGIGSKGAPINEYVVKMFGGGNMFPLRERGEQQHVGKKNAEAGRELVKRHGLRAYAEDLEGVGHRTVLFDIWSGHVWVRKFQPAAGFCGALQDEQA